MRGFRVKATAQAKGRPDGQLVSAKTPSWYGKSESPKTKSPYNKRTISKMEPISSGRKGGGRAGANKRRRRLAVEARSVSRRLRSAVAPNFPAGARPGQPLLRTRGAGQGDCPWRHGRGGQAGEKARVGQRNRCLCPPARRAPALLRSDHVLNIAYSALCGAKTLDDIELRRQDQVFLDDMGAKSLPHPTTAGGFCRFQQSSRRLDEGSVMAFQEAVNRYRLRAWARQGAGCLSTTAVIDADATIAPTGAEKKEGVDIGYNGTSTASIGAPASAASASEP